MEEKRYYIMELSFKGWVQSSAALSWDIALTTLNSFRSDFPKARFCIMKMEEEMEPRIVCAANKYGDTIILGIRHFDMFMHQQLEQLGLHHKDHEQGFVDQFGKFYTREEAWGIALKNYQIIRDVSNPGVLYSENLY